MIVLSAFWLSSRAADAETVRIAHQADFPPFIFVKNGKSVGLIVDILNAAAAREKIEIVYVPVPFAQVHATLANGEADAIVPLAITPERKKSYSFSFPLVTTGGALFVRAPGPTPIRLAALAGKTIVTPKTGPFVSYLQKHAAKSKLIVAANYLQSFQYVLSGEADAAALNFQVGTTMVARSYLGKVTAPKDMFIALPLAVAVTKGQHAKFLKELNAGLAVIRTDGTYQRINAKWSK